MSHTHDFSLKTLKHFRLKGLWGIYLNTAFRDLGLNLFVIFLPVYIYELTGRLSAVFLFVAIYNLMILPASWFSAKLIQKIGVDNLEFFSTLVRAIFLGFLIYAKQDPSFLWLAAFFYGIAIAFCWIPYHFMVVCLSDHDHYGSTVSKIEIISKLTLGLAPFLGGLIIVSFGYDTLFFISIVILLISGVVIYFDNFDRKKVRFNMDKMIARFKRPSLRNFWLSLVGNGIETEVCGVAWYLYIFIAVSSYTVLGGIQSISILASIIVLWLVGNWVDKKGPRILNLGVVGNIINWLVRPFLISGVFLFLSDIIYRFLSILIWTPFMAVIYKKTSQMHSLEVIVQREWVLHATGFVASLVLFFLTEANFGWWAIFSFGVVGLLMLRLIISDEKKPKVYV